MVSRRRIVLHGLPAALAVGAGNAVTPAQAQSPVGAPAVHRDPELRFAGGVDMRSFAEPSSTRTSGEQLQAALDAAYAASAPLFLPKGEYVTERPLSIRNVSGRDRAMPWIVGRGVGETVLTATPFSGAVLTVRGVAEGPLKRGHFLRGGGLGDLEIRGLADIARDGESGQHGLAVMGWMHGALEHIRIRELTGDGLRSIGDPAVDRNPDWTASILSLDRVSIQRLGGWAFRDDNPIGSPGWAWRQCILQLAGLGGALVRSSGHSFTGCSFSACGWISETKPGPAGGGISLHLDGSLNRTHIADCEFDSARTAHIVLDNTSAATIERTRFIHNDRYGAGMLTPPVGVVIAGRGDRSGVHGIVFRQILFRIDTPGEMVGFKWVSTANVTDIEVKSVSWSDETRGQVRLEKFAGHTQRQHNTAQNYRLDDGGMLQSAGMPAAFIKARLAPHTLDARWPAALGGWTATPDIAQILDRPSVFHSDGTNIALPFAGWWDVDITVSVALASGAGRVVLAVMLDGRSADDVPADLGGGIGALRYCDRLYARAGDSLAMMLSGEPGRAISIQGGRLLIRHVGA